MFPLDLKGRFYATLAVLYITGTFYARYFGAYLPLSLNIIIILQVCLMSQSWDNVASMHDHLLTVHAHKT